MKDTDFFFSDALFQDLLFKWKYMNMLYQSSENDKNRNSSCCCFIQWHIRVWNHWEIKLHLNQISVCYSNSPETGPGSNCFHVKFLNFIVCYLSHYRLHDWRSLTAKPKSPLGRHQLRHPWGSKTEFSSITSWTYNGVHHCPPKTLL